MNCFVCSTPALAGLSLATPDEIAASARAFVDGMSLHLNRIDEGGADDLLNVAKDAATRAPRADESNESDPYDAVLPIVERCARLAEADCGACGVPTCAGCHIAMKLRSNQERIEDEFGAELDAVEATLNTRRPTLSQTGDTFVDKLSASFCERHEPFGIAVQREWHTRRALAALA